MSNSVTAALKPHKESSKKLDSQWGRSLDAPLSLLEPLKVNTTTVLMSGRKSKGVWERCVTPTDDTRRTATPYMLIVVLSCEAA